MRQAKATVTGTRTVHATRLYQDREIVPCKYFKNGKGSGIMVAQYKDTRDLVMDQQGYPVSWAQA